MKVKHNAILILVSSKWLIPSSGVCSWYQILGSKLFIFSFRSSKLFQLYHFKASSNHCKASPGVLFNFPFRLIILLLPEFFMEAIRDASSRILFILQLFFKISLGVKIRQSILYNKHGALHMFVLRSSSILHLAFRSAIRFTLSFEVVFCHSWQFEFAFQDSHVVKNEIF